jgi:cytochrome c biogenesis protein CcmG, thiol:disulfide interchange protein DsbE
VSVRSSIAVLAALAVVGLLAFGLLSKGSAGVQVGDSVPSGSLPRLGGGGSESLADYRGRWVLVNVWASWCVPCRDEAPALEEFQRQYGGERFTVLGIDSSDLSEDGLRFVNEFGVSYPQLHDGSGDFADEFGAKGVPESYLVDPRGKVRVVALGAVSTESLENELSPLLAAEKS